MIRCRRCNRWLKREPYATQGIGKICARKLGIEQASERQTKLQLDWKLVTKTTRSNFEYCLDGNILAIIDMGGGYWMSVTNDIEQVLAAIQQDGVDVLKYGIIYRDSDGIWDAVIIDRNEQRIADRVYFEPLRMMDYHSAKSTYNQLIRPKYETQTSKDKTQAGS